MPITQSAQGASTVKKRGRPCAILTPELIQKRLESKRARQAKYMSKPESKADVKEYMAKYIPKYYSDPEIKAKLLESNARYQQTQAWKDSLKKYQQSEKGKAAIAKSHLKQKEKRQAIKALKLAKLPKTDLQLYQEAMAKVQRSD